MKIKLVIFMYRLQHKIFKDIKPKVLSVVLLKLTSIIKFLFVTIPFGCDIPYQCEIGRNLRLVHLNGIIISKYAKIGENCTILHQVTIGVNDRKDSRKAATIGNNVFIGAGAKIIGNIKIGDNVSIGANAVVTKDIGNNCTVIEFNKILKKKEDEKK